MKKLLTCICAGVMLLSLVACTSNEKSNGEITEETVPQYKELEDPRGKTLESTATGESDPQIAETLYETDDIVIADYIPTKMGYAVDPTGQTDSTVGIQSALNDCFDAGGGTVYLPAGNYAISGTIYVPPFVTLRGDWQDPDTEGFDGNYGTIISVWMDAEDEETAGAFRMGGSAGVVGLTVYYPMQSLDCIVPYPYTFYIGAKVSDYMLSTIRNVTIINGYRGIGTEYDIAHEQLKIDNVKGTFLKYGMYLTNSADVGSVKRVSISNKYWKEASADCMNAVQGSLIDDYTKRFTTGLKIGDLEFHNFNDVSVDGCAIGMHIVKGSRTNFSGTMYDLSITNCEQGILCDSLDERWGVVLARSYVEGGITNNSKGKWKLCDVEVVGELAEKKEGSYIIDEEADMSEYEISYDYSYEKPVANLHIGKLENGVYTDAGPDLQVAVDKVASEGGGIVYVPAGVYRFRTPVSVPAGVEVRGSSSVASREQRACSKGTIFMCYYGDDVTNTADDQAFITLAGENAGLNGVRIIYPENSARTEDINTTYTIRGLASNVYVVNSTIAASAYGIDFRGCDNHYIKEVFVTCYYNAFCLGGENGVMSETLVNGTIMTRVNALAGLEDWISEAENFALLIDPVLREKCDCIKVEGATNQLIYNSFAYGVHTYITNIDSENTKAINIGTDNLNDEGPQINAQSGSLVGINILRYNGYSWDAEDGSLELYNRIAINEVGEKNIQTTDK